MIKKYFSGENSALEWSLVLTKFLFHLKTKRKKNNCCLKASVNLCTMRTSNREKILKVRGENKISGSSNYILYMYNVAVVLLKLRFNLSGVSLHFNKKS